MGRKVEMPQGFALSDRVRSWARGKGYGQLEGHFEYFTLQAEKLGLKYCNWDSALMTAIRDDWAHLRTDKNGKPLQVVTGAITCETCGTIARNYTGRQCDPCWRGVRRAA